MGLNHFADMTEAEFKEYATCSKTMKGEGIEDEHCPTGKDCTELAKTSRTSIDWTTMGAVTPIKNQGDCGSCWAFGAVGGLEGRYYLNNKILFSFSEQYILDCDHTSVNGCEGGFGGLALLWSAKKGSILEKLYPYKGVDEACLIPKNVSLIHVNNGISCVKPKDLEQMKAAVAIQPVTIGVDANSW